MFITQKNCMLQPGADNKHIHESTDKMNIYFSFSLKMLIEQTIKKTNPTQILMKD